MKNATDAKSLWRELNQQKTADELFKSIPSKIPQGVATMLLCVLAACPLMAGIFAPLDTGFLTAHLPLYTAICSIGNCGLLFGFFMLLWNKYNTAKVSGSFRQKLCDNGVWIFLLAMLLWSILSTLFSTNPEISLFGYSFRRDGLIAYFAYAGIFATAIQLRSKKHMLLILNIFVGAASALALLGILDIETVNTYMRITPDASIFFNINHYGYYLCMAAMAAVTLFVCEGDGKLSKVKKVFVTLAHGFELVLLSNALIQCKTLSSLLAVAFALVSLLVLTVFVNRKSLKSVVLAVFIMALSAGISSVGVWDFKAELQARDADLLTISEAVSGQAADTTAINKIGSGRGILLINAVKFIGERPVFGYGPDNLGERYTQIGAKNDRPHCEILQFAASLGIPAAVFYLLSMFFLLLIFIRRFKGLDMLTLCAYSIVGAYLISSLFGNTMFYTTPFFFMLLGISYAMIRQLSGACKKA